jgi:hypothetical protein
MSNNSLVNLNADSSVPEHFLAVFNSGAIQTQAAGWMIQIDVRFLGGAAGFYLLCVVQIGSGPPFQCVPGAHSPGKAAGA